MSLNKKRMVREIGRRTRLPNRDVERMLDALIAVWTDELLSGGRIEIEHFMTIATHTLEQPSNRLLGRCQFRKVTVRVSKALREKISRNITGSK
ncbi:MAG: HU family DNA-binding protein [Chloroflexota bacterium]|nr:HU family DNA-binding protein [Chloroflexota bacterium]